MTVDDGDLQDLSFVWRPEPQTRGAVGLSARYGFLSRPYWPIGQSDPLLDTVSQLDLSAHIAGSERIAVGVNLPIFMSSYGDTQLDDGVYDRDWNGTNMGDLRVTAPIGIVLPDFHSGGFGLSAVPAFTLPIGATNKYLGDGGFSGALSLSPSYSWLGLAQLTAQLGIGGQPSRDLPNRSGGGHLILGVGGGIELHRTLALRGELLHEQSLTAGDDSPAVGAASVRGRYRNGLVWTAGGGLDLQNFTASGPRFFVQLGWVGTRPMDRDIDLDGIVDADDSCRFKEETANGYNDDDGCPDQLAELGIRVMDLLGEPIAGANVGVESVRVRSGGDGWARVKDFIPETEPVILVDAKGYKPQMLRDVTLQPGANSQVVTLDYSPADLQLEVRAADTGLPIDAQLRITGPGNVDSQNTGKDGLHNVPLRPGTWMVAVYADFFEEKRIEVDVEPGVEEIPLEVELKRTGVAISKEEVIGGVRILFDKDSERFDPAWKPFLHDLAQTLLVYEYVDVVVHGHSDDGEKGANLDKKRAEAAVAYLIEEGVAPDRLSVEAHGSTQPAQAEGQPDGANRRVQFTMVPPEHLVIDDVVRFAPGSSELDAQARSVVRSVASELSDNPLWRVEVEGHADASEGDRLIPISMARAEAVKRALIEAGVPARRLRAKARGGTVAASTLALANPRASFQALPLDDLTVEVPFAEGSAELDDKGADRLGAAIRRLKAAEHLRVEVHGHRGAQEDKALSKQRRDAVIEVMIGEGIDGSRLLGIDHGYEKAGPKVAFTLRIQPAVPYLVHFPPGEAAFDVDQIPMVEKLARRLKAWPHARVDLVAYTHTSDGELAAEPQTSDSGGPEGEGDPDPLDPAAVGLASARAYAVKVALQELGVPSRRIRLVTRYAEAGDDLPQPGDDEPDVDEATMGRRVEVRVR